MKTFQIWTFVFALFSFAAGLEAEPGKISRPLEVPAPDRFIVVLKEGFSGDVQALASRLAAEQNGTLRLVYQNALKGFALSVSEAGALAITNDPAVDFVEQDSGGRPNQAGASCSPVSFPQTMPSQSLDRIDQTDTRLDGRYSAERTGCGVDIYIVDSGIAGGAGEFTGRVIPA